MLFVAFDTEQTQEIDVEITPSPDLMHRNLQTLSVLFCPT